MEKIINFVEGFFKNIGASLSWDKDILEINNIPASFESFYGKKAPYYFSFIGLKENNSEIEFITGNSFLIGCIKDFLQTRGQTTLLRIVLEDKLKEKILKNFFLKNSSIQGIVKQEKSDYLLRFNFQTIFQYLNLKEQVNKEFYFYHGEKVNFNLKDYQTLEGKGQELDIGSIKKEYSMAKEEVKKAIQSNISQISIELDGKLDKELKRIREHFVHQIKEITQKKENLEKDLKVAEKNNPTRAEKLKKAIEEIDTSEIENKLKKEEEFLINDEKHKHALNVSTRLVNTTIVSFPIYQLKINLLGSASGVMDLEYHPLLEKFSKIYCSSCKKEIQIINLCSSGHVSCDKCFRGCSNCGKDYCNPCLERTCFSCGKRLCKKCSKKCFKCGKYKCVSHFSSLGVCETCRNK